MDSARTAEPFASDPASAAPRGGQGREHADAGAQDPAGAARPAAEGGILATLLRFVEQLGGPASDLVEIHADRLRLSMRRAITTAVVGACVAVCAAIWLGAATLALLRGACGGLTELWGGRAWLGDLTGGLLALGLVAGAIAVIVRMSARRELKRLKAKYDQRRNKRASTRGPATTSADGGGVA
jgi:hypothetical protein